ncbi:hypothetical protein PG994_007748 [Apiospora phragmitis]|uniref:Ecp2 effector protein-like domain-containing protein n=1 Tax=Apiospora phragmitis TaxID=2905665 RepID=A0ABR1UR32_9PEZI
MMKLTITSLLCMTATTLAGAIPAPVAYRNVTLLDGTIMAMELPAGVRFVSEPNAAAVSSSSGHGKRLSWHPGSENDECEDNQYYTDKTTSSSPNVADCKWIADVESLPDNQGYFEGRAAQDYKDNGDWCRMMIHSTCVFGTKTSNMWGAKVGTHDIATEIYASIAKNYGRGVMQWEGRFKCWNESGEKSTVDWAVFTNT